MQTTIISKKRVKYLKDNFTIIEKELSVNINIKEELAEIEGDSLEEYLAKDVINAISKGFDIQIALKVINQEILLKTIDLKDFLSDQKIKTQIGRVIGNKGKSKKIIEEEGKVNLSISEHEVSIIGHYEDVEIAINGIQKLITGTPHTNVYRYLSEAQAKKSGKL